MILIEATIKYKGYDPRDLAKFSHKEVCVSCDKCGRVRYTTYNNYNRCGNLCRLCSYTTPETKQKMRDNAPHISGKDHHNWKGGKIIKFCEICGNEFKVKQIHKNQKFCSKKCYGKYQSINHIGKDAQAWKGGHDKYQSHLVPIYLCNQLNKRFKGSEGHHVNKNIVIFIPKELHVHVRHNMKTGKNMNIINTLALQFINGEL